MTIFEANANQMKTNLVLFIILILLSIFLSCSSEKSKNNSNDNNDSSITNSANIDSLSHQLMNTDTLIPEQSLSLCGVWHSSPNVGSGYTDLYIFTPDGRFEFRTNQMDCTQRLESYGGVWKFNSRKLELNIDEVCFYVGGHEELDETSCACGVTLIGAKTIKVKIKQLVPTIYPCYEAIKLNTESGEKRKILNIDNQTYYYIADNKKDLGL